MNIPYTFHAQLILRTPGLPLPGMVNEALISSLLHNNHFLEAIYLASPVLYDECIKWKSGTLTDKKQIQKLTRALSKYYTRMSSRCTPFGLFSGCAVAEWNAKPTGLVLDGGNSRRHTRLDMHYLCALAQKLAGFPGIKEQLLYFPNNSLYMMGDEIRYVEYQYADGKRHHQISSVHRSGYVQTILEKAEQGVSYPAMIDLLKSDDVTEQETIDFIDELIASQLLVHELEPAITGKEFIYQVLDVLKRLHKNGNQEIDRTIEILETTEQLLQQLDNQCGNDAMAYRHILQLLSQLNLQFEENKLFQTDTIHFLAEPYVHEGLQTELLQALNVLNKISSSRTNENLQQFARRFSERYEDKEMPLLQVLDTETGIGYLENNSSDITPLLEGIAPPNKENDITYVWSNWEKLLSGKLRQVEQANENTLYIADTDLTALTVGWDDLPPSLAVMFRLVNATDNTIYLESAGGSSAANLLGRFAHAHEGINNLVCEVTKIEQERNPGVQFAEIIHLPESRTGNILLHPVFRAYEIPYLAKSSLDAAHQVAVKDLYISVKNNRVLLHSRKTGKQIIPRLSTAHNYSYNALPVYQFLCDLQLQGNRGGLGFSWGSLQTLHAYLPRVQYNNTILYLATWKLEKNDWERLLNKTGDTLMKAVATFREFWKLPRFVVLADSDNELLVDFESELLVQTWLDSIKNRSAVVIKEFLWNNNSVTDKNGLPLANQLVAILVKNKATYTEPLAPKISLQQPVQRQFSPGSEWLYYKLYCGIKSADKILLQAIKPLTEALLEKKWIDKWFFIRYNDPGFHLRLRLHLTDVAQLGDVMQAVREYLRVFEEDGYLWKLQLDTYTRELERYGGSAIELTETFFYHDSVALLEMLDLTWGDEREKIRWRWGLRAVDELLGCFNLSLNDKSALLTSMKDAFAREFSMDKAMRLQLNEKVRDNKEQIEWMMNDANHHENELHSLVQVLQEKSAKITPIAQQLQQLHQDGQLPVAIPDLLSSYVHMLLNRVITSSPRLHEMVLYDFLFRYYQSQKARQRQENLVIEKDQAPE